MKNFIKKGLAITLVLICAFALCLTLVACSSNEGSKTITLVIGEGETQEVFSNYKTDAEYLVNVLDELKADEEITYACEESTYGAYLTEVNELTNSADAYIYIFSTVVEQQDTTEWAEKRTYNDEEYVSVILGVSTLPVIDGASYMIATVVSVY
jgi:hypothetical protein